MRADRLLSMLMLLQVHGQIKAAELAERLEISQRTVYRDVEALSAAGVPIYTERGPGGGINLLESYRTTLNGLHENEVQALIGFGDSELLSDLGIDQAYKSARLKLLATLPTTLQGEAQRVQHHLYLDPAAWFQLPDPLPHLHLVQEAVWNARRLRMRYRTSGGSWIQVLIDPYGLVAKAGVWYVVGATFGRVRVYRVSRIEDSGLAQSRFEFPEAFDLKAFWEDWCASFEGRMNRFEVVVRVAPEAAQQLVELFGEAVYRRLAQSPLVDPAGHTEMTISFSSHEEAATQLLGLGTGVEVVTPLALRRSLRQRALQISELYSDASA